MSEDALGAQDATKIFPTIDGRTVEKYRVGMYWADPFIEDARLRLALVDSAYRLPTSDPRSGSFNFNIAAGDVANTTHVHKFGRHEGIGTSFVPVAIGGIWRTPQVANATTLRVKAGNANDTALGTGAREITLEVLDETGALVTEAIPTAGESAGAASTVTAIRLNRAYVSESGSYATVAGGSHAASIVVENGSGGTDWGTIVFEDSTPRGQTEIGAYTVPLGNTAYISNLIVSGDSTKISEFLFYQRRDILQTAAPYSSMRVVVELGGVAGEEEVNTDIPLGPFPALTDLFFLGKSAAGTPEVDVDFEIILVAD